MDSLASGLSLATQMNKTCPLFILVSFAFSAWSQSVEGDAGNSILKIGSIYSKLPDMRLKYGVTFLSPKGRVETKREFTKKGSMWRVEVRGLEGELQSVVAYDGQVYQELNLRNNRLNIASSIDKLGRGVAFDAKSIPLAFPYLPIFGSPESTLNPGQLFTTIGWASRIKNISLSEEKISSEGEMLVGKSDQWDFQMLFGKEKVMPYKVKLGMKAMGKTIWRTILVQNLAHYNVGGVDVTVPADIATVDSETEKAGTRDVLVHLDSLTALGGGVSADSFTIPISSAKFVEDRDIRPYLRQPSEQMERK